MRINQFLVAALAATTLFASCAKEEGRDGKENGKEDAVVRFTLKGTSTGSRAALGATAYDGEELGVNLWDATVFIIGANDAIISKKYLSNTLLATPVDNNEIATTTAAKYVIVVGNTGSDMTGSGGKFNVTTLTDLKKVIFTLPEAVVLTTAGANATTLNQRILLQGQSADLDWSTSTMSSTDPEIKLAATTVTLYPVPARLDVQALNRMELSDNVDWEDEYVKLEYVSILYSANNTFAVPTVTGSDRTLRTAYSYAVPTTGFTFTPSHYYVSGFDPAATTVGIIDDTWDVLENPSGTVQNAYATGASLTYLNRAWSTAGPLATSAPFDEDNDFRGTFYALPGNAAHGAYTTVAVVGTYDSDGANGPIQPQRYYWHVRLNPTDGGEILKNGERYDVKIALKGVVTNSGGGTTTPDEDIVDGFVEVDIVPGKWDTPISIVKNIQ